MQKTIGQPCTIDSILVQNNFNKCFYHQDDGDRAVCRINLKVVFWYGTMAVEAMIKAQSPRAASAISSAVDPPARNSSGINTSAMSTLGDGGNASKFFPGIGKILALPSQQACDVDAFVGSNTYDENDDAASSMGSSTGTTGVSYRYDDFEPNGNSMPSTHSVRKDVPPLDPDTDPFASRVGKTLTWRNVNMTLVRCVLDFWTNIHSDDFVLTT
jgi:hypothetical protein